MARFKDNKGTKWDVTITLGVLEEIRESLDIDLGIVSNYEKHVSNMIDAANILYMICRRQATERGIDDEVFGQRLVGDAFDRGIQALHRAFLSFVPGRQRAHLAGILAAAEKSQEVRSQVIQKMVDALGEKAKSGTLERLDTSWEEFSD